MLIVVVNTTPNCKHPLHLLWHCSAAKEIRHNSNKKNKRARRRADTDKELGPKTYYSRIRSSFEWSCCNTKKPHMVCVRRWSLDGFHNMSFSYILYLISHLAGYFAWRALIAEATTQLICASICEAWRACNLTIHKKHSMCICKNTHIGKTITTIWGRALCFNLSAKQPHRVGNRKFKLELRQSVKAMLAQCAQTCGNCWTVLPSKWLMLIPDLAVTPRLLQNDW